MAFRETEIGERGHLFPDAVGDLAGRTVACHAGIKTCPQAVHSLGATFGPHCLAQLISLSAAETGDIDRHLHQLFLEQRYPERFCEAALEQGVQVSHILGVVAPPQVRVDRTALDGAGAYEGYFYYEVVESTRPEPGERPHLRSALDLENPDGVCLGEHFVDEGVLW